MSTLSITKTKARLSIKVQTLYIIAAIVAAVAVPQLFHMVGAISGVGTVPGATFLPMHLPIILVGILAGPWAGAIAGLLGPVASYALSGMPGIIVLPFMMVELFGYGLSAGLLRQVKVPSVAKVLISQISGRLLRFIAVLVAIYLLGNTKVDALSIWTAAKVGLPGIIIQLTFLPLIVYRLEGKNDNQ